MTETCVKHDRVLDKRFIIRDHLILNSVYYKIAPLLAILESKTYRHSRLELSKLPAKKGKTWYVLASRKLYRQTKCIFLYTFLRIFTISLKKNLSNARSVAILFAVRDLNFNLIIFAKFKCSKHFCKFERQLHDHFNTS